MTPHPEKAMSATQALRIEFAIIGIGVLALVMIFQPFALPIFSAGCGLVVLAALANNMLPFAQPGRPLRGVIFAGVIVAFTFCVVLLLSIAAADLYGKVFLKGASTTSLVPPGPPYWQHPMIWTLAALALALAILIRAMTRKGPRP
jgi:hypothetical protein